MAFALVQFTEEDDAPGIVASNWMLKEENKCFYPNVSNEEKKNKLLLGRATPEKNWLQCPIKIIKEFSSYKAARNRLTEVEQSSNIESEVETRPRRRKIRYIHFPRETSSSSEDEVIKKKKHRPVITQSSYMKKSNIVGIPPPPVPLSLNDSSGEESVLLLQQSNLSHQGSVSEIERLKANQATMWSAIAEVTNIVKANSSKLDMILNKLESFTSNSSIPSEGSTTDIKLISSLPVSIEDFETLNSKIMGSPLLRKNLVNILVTAGGRDAKSLVASMLRKVISDDVAEKFSLTGRAQKDTPPKESFEKTAVYKLIIHSCSQVYPQSNENIMREGISDWLMQSKFRKIRKEKKKKPEVADAFELTFSNF